MTIPAIERELFFDEAEYDQRLAALRNAMAARGIDTLMLAGPENIYYVSGYQTFGFHNYQLLIVPSEGKPFLILRYLESMLAYRYALDRRHRSMGNDKEDSGAGHCSASWSPQKISHGREQSGAEGRASSFQGRPLDEKLAAVLSSSRSNGSGTCGTWHRAG